VYLCRDMVVITRELTFPSYSAPVSSCIYGDALSKGRIGQGTHQARDASAKGLIRQRTHCQRTLVRGHLVRGHTASSWSGSTVLSDLRLIWVIWYDSFLSFHRSTLKSLGHCPILSWFYVVFYALWPEITRYLWFTSGIKEVTQGGEIL
jgi:hypothetical protein